MVSDEEGDELFDNDAPDPVTFSTIIYRAFLIIATALAIFFTFSNAWSAIGAADDGIYDKAIYYALLTGAFYYISGQILRSW